MLFLAIYLWADVSKGVAQSGSTMAYSVTKAAGEVSAIIEEFEMLILCKRSPFNEMPSGYPRAQGPSKCDTARPHADGMGVPNLWMPRRQLSADPV